MALIGIATLTFLALYLVYRTRTSRIDQAIVTALYLFGTSVSVGWAL